MYRNDAEARDGHLRAQERSHFHQERSRPVMGKLHSWLEAQFAERKTESNSGLGKSHHLSAASLEGVDNVFTRGWSATGQ